MNGMTKWMSTMDLNVRVKGSQRTQIGCRECSQMRICCRAYAERYAALLLDGFLYSDFAIPLEYG